MALLEPYTIGSSTSCTQWFCHPLDPKFVALAMGTTPSVPPSTMTASPLCRLLSRVSALTVFPSQCCHWSMAPTSLPLSLSPCWPVFLPTACNSMIHLYRKPPAFIYLQHLTPCHSSSSFGTITASVNLVLYPLCPLLTYQTVTSGDKPTATWNPVKLKFTPTTSNGALLLLGHPSIVWPLGSVTSRLQLPDFRLLLRPPAPSLPSSLSTNVLA